MTDFPYDAPKLSANNQRVNALNIEYAKAKIPKELPRSKRLVVEENIKRLLKAHNAVLVAHYYVADFLQTVQQSDGHPNGVQAAFGRRIRSPSSRV